MIDKLRSNSVNSHFSIKQRAASMLGGTVLVLGLLTFSSLVVAGVYAETVYGLGAKPLACQSDELMKGDIFRNEIVN